VACPAQDGRRIHRVRPLRGGRGVQLTRLNTNECMSLQRHGAGRHGATTLCHGGWLGVQTARGRGAHETSSKSENLDCKGQCMPTTASSICQPVQRCPGPWVSRRTPPRPARSSTARVRRIVPTPPPHTKQPSCVWNAADSRAEHHEQVPLGGGLNIRNPPIPSTHIPHAARPAPLAPLPFRRRPWEVSGGWRRVRCTPPRRRPEKAEHSLAWR